MKLRQIIFFPGVHKHSGVAPKCFFTSYYTFYNQFLLLFALFFLNFVKKRCCKCQKDDYNQRMASEASIGWLKYTKGRRDYRRPQFGIVRLTMPCLTFIRDRRLNVDHELGRKHHFNVILTVKNRHFYL